MKQIITIITTLVLAIWLSGCVYPNECGASLYYYNDKKSVYDSQGNYIEECPQNNVYTYPEDKQQYIKQD